MRLLLTLLLICTASLAWAGERVSVFAAASLGDALGEALAVWEEVSGQETVLSAAGSSVLARQIAAGAPADIYVSANTDWVDWLEGQGVTQPGSRRELMGNRLVLVSSSPATGAAPEITADFDLEARLGQGRLALALVQAVPAGLYAKAALTTLGLWEGIADQTAQTDNVRAALALVALGEAPLGIVYATDAAAEPRVHIVGHFPEASHAPIRYPAVMTQDAGPAAAELLTWLTGPQAQAIFAEHGFVVAPE
ncbi:MAG: molybdate ABC transporter substrate-binding protein [Paracoccaceae bacterium]|nr:molybdate ABC transporter substrate-binding protein [Paracoccaceae bacterium]